VGEGLPVSLSCGLIAALSNRATWLYPHITTTGSDCRVWATLAVSTTGCAASSAQAVPRRRAQRRQPALLLKRTSVRERPGHVSPATVLGMRDEGVPTELSCGSNAAVFHVANRPNLGAPSQAQGSTHRRRRAVATRVIRIDVMNTGSCCVS